MRSVLIFLLTSICYGQSPALQQYLGLTGAQVPAIARLNSDYQRNFSAQQNRVFTLHNELALLYSRPAPDPNQLGARYAELEAIRRGLAAQLATLQTQLAAQLTPVQTSALQNLKNAAEAQPLVSDAQCGFLLDGNSSPQFFNASSFTGVLGLALTLNFAPTSSLCGSSTYPISIHQYLNLTDAQISSIYNASAAYTDYSTRKQDRMSDLYLAIRDETAKPSSDPAVLGSLYAELTSIGADIQNQGNQLRQTARSVLTAQQAAQLAALQNDVTLQPLISEAEALGLLVLPRPPSDNSLFIDAPFPVPVPVIPPATQALAAYLSLTSQQIQAIRGLNASYQTFLNAQNQRANTLNNELSKLYATPSPDPTQLGVRYVELESIRRDIAAHLTTLQTQNAALLTKAQISGLQSLNTAAELQPLIGDAQCGFLVDPSPISSFPNVFFGVPASAVRSGDFSTLSSLTFTYPYIPPAPTASFCGSTVYPISVRQYLNLTDAEVTTIFAQSAAYNDYYARKQNRISDVNVEIRDQTAQPSPDPLALGLRYSELQGIGQELQTAGTQLRQTARATLTTQQSAQLKTLQDTQALQPVISQAQGCNLLVLAPGTGSNTATFSVIFDPTTGGPGGLCPL